MAAAMQKTSMNRLTAVGVTIASGVVALFVPFLSAFISVILLVKLNKMKEAWAKSVVVANVVIGIVNLTVTILAIGIGSMLSGIA